MSFAFSPKIQPGIGRHVGHSDGPSERCCATGVVALICCHVCSTLADPQDGLLSLHSFSNSCRSKYLPPNPPEPCIFGVMDCVCCRIRQASGPGACQISCSSSPLSKFPLAAQGANHHVLPGEPWNPKIARWSHASRASLRSSLVGSILFIFLNVFSTIVARVIFTEHADSHAKVLIGAQKISKNIIFFVRAGFHEHVSMQSQYRKLTRPSAILI